MCTVVVLRRPGHAWPLVLGANRDEMIARPSAPPAAHWPGRPGVVAGLDHEAGGTWLGVNAHGLVAGVMNRVGSLGPALGMRSRGELPLIALGEPEADAASRAVLALDGAAYRPFNLVVADRRNGYWLSRRDGSVAIERRVLPEGLSMLTAHDLNDTASRRIRHFLPRFAEAKTPEPSTGAWDGWAHVLASRDHDPEGGPQDAMTIWDQGAAFGTVSSSLIAVDSKGRVVWRFANGRPDLVPFEDIPLPRAALRR